jgi:hypothetical protein
MPSYVAVVWTGGDIITEAKLDNMVANDRAEDAHAAGQYFDNNSKIQFRNASAALDAAIYEDSTNVLRFTQGSAGMKGLDLVLATQIRGSIASGSNRAQFPFASRAMTITEVAVRVAGDGVNPAATQMVFDINLNGVSIWAATQANRLKLNSGASSGSATSFDTTTVSKYDNFSLDVDTTDATVQNLIFEVIGI